MIKQTIDFVDYNNQQRQVVEWFHINEAELIDMQAHSEFGLEADLDKAIKSGDVGQILDFIKFLVHKSYGQKDTDGIHFNKSEELTQKFINSAYYSDFLLGLIENDGEKGAAFIQGVLPKKLIDRALAQAKGNPEAEAALAQFMPDAREQFAQAQKVATQPAPIPAPAVDIEYARYLEWKAAQDAAQTAQAVPAIDPNAFRVQENEPLQGFQQ